MAYSNKLNGVSLYSKVNGILSSAIVKINGVINSIADVLLMHMDGSDNGTVFTDDSPSAHQVTRYNAVTKTGTKKFGREWTASEGNFDGTNGDKPNKDLWRDVYDNFTIQNNTAEVTTSTSDRNSSLQSLFAVSGDFDIQVDFTGMAYPSTNTWAWQLRATVDGNNRYDVMLRFTSGALYYSAVEKQGGAFGTRTSVATSDTSGKFRLARVGSTMTAYYWNGSTWSTIRSESWVTNDIKVELVTASSSTGYPTNTVRYDNLVITADTVISAGASAYFDGDGDYLTIPYSTDFDFDTGDFTIDFWFKVVSITDWDIPLHCGTGSSNATSNWHVSFNASDQIRCTVFENDTPNSAVNASDVVTGGNWHHYAAVRYGRHLMVAVDGAFPGGGVFTGDDFTGVPEGFTGDDFTGTNGDPPNALIWNSNGPYIDQNSLYNSVSEGEREYIESVFHMEGNFDIQVAFTTVLNPASNYWYVGLFVTGDDLPSETTQNCFFQRIQYINSLTFTSDMMTGGAWSGAADADTTSQTQGKFRIIRTGDSFESRYWNGSVWVSQGSWSNASMGDTCRVYMEYRSWGGSGPTADAFFDTFTINSGVVTVAPKSLNWKAYSGDSLPIIDSNKLKFQVGPGGVDKNTIFLLHGDGDQSGDDGTFTGDDFTGTSGDPDSTVWSISNTSSNLGLNTNFLWYDSTEAGGDSFYMYSVPLISGDFDIQIDVAPSAVDTAGSTVQVASLAIYYDRARTQYSQILYQKTTGGVWRFAVQGSSTSFVVANESKMDTKIRFTRSGSVLKVYYWDVGANRWEWNGSTAGKTLSETYTTDIEFGFGSTQLATYRLAIKYDNYTINSGTVIWPDRTVTFNGNPKYSTLKGF
jgi:hypothetical protein